MDSGPETLLFSQPEAQCQHDDGIRSYPLVAIGDGWPKVDSQAEMSAVIALNAPHRAVSPPSGLDLAVWAGCQDAHLRRTTRNDLVEVGGE